MAIYINGSVVPSTHFHINGSIPSKVYVNGVQAWINQYAPTSPTNFSASDSSAGSVTCTWTNSSDTGIPTCTYNLYENSTLVASNISSGYVRSVSSGTRTYYVRATNVAGYSNSNTNSGTSIAPPGSQTFTSSGSFTAPVGYSSVTVCMVGGGGGAAAGTYHKGGGYSGAIVSQSVSVSGGSSYTVTIGAGGNGASNAGNGAAWGSNGSASSFGSTSAAGGGRGDAGTGGSYFSGSSGANRTTCGGSANNGTNYNEGGWYCRGGQSSGFGKGGNGNRQWQLGQGFRAESGVLGAGGGAGRYNGGHGGTGKCVVSWS